MGQGAAQPGDERIMPVSGLPAHRVEQVYRLLVASFRPEELPDPDEFRHRYTGAEPQASGVLLRDGAPVGAYLTETFLDGAVLLLSHLAVSPLARGGGIGSRLLRHLLDDLPDPGPVVLGEADDPRVWPATAGTGDPVARLAFYARHGARLVPVAHVQPRMRPDGERVRGMVLFRLDRHGRTSPGLLGRFLAAYATATEGPEALQDPELAALVERATHVDLDHDLLAMTDWPRIPVTR